jgi:Zn-dependent protease
VDIQVSWPPVFLFVAWFLAGAFFPRVYPGRALALYWLLGFVASFLLFASLLAHEFGHAVVARWRGLLVHRVSLFVLGGLVEIDFLDSGPDDELLVALAGPATSLAMGGIFAIFWLVARPLGFYVAGLATYLTFCNVLLAGFNLMPGLPLDGGRVLRAGLWRLLGCHDRATWWSHWLGQGLAGLGLLSGALLAVGGEVLAGVWIAAVGVFLIGAGWSQYARA